MRTSPHHQAAFINVIAEEGTKAEAVQYLQQTWNDYCEARLQLLRFETALREIATADDNVSGGFRFHNIARKALGMEPRT